MATTISETQTVGDQRVAIRFTDWDGFETLLAIRGDRSAPLILYLDGTIYLSSHNFLHERLRARFGRLVASLVEEFNTPCLSSGSTTFRRRDKEAAVEPDLSFYLANEKPMRGKLDIDLNIDPPPDLAIEVTCAHDNYEAIEVYRLLGVPEVWDWEKDRLRMLCLNPSGEYAQVERSLAFPILAAGEAESWVSKNMEENDTAWAKELQNWIRSVLVPRHREMEAGASE